MSAALTMARHPRVAPAPTSSDLTTKYMSKPRKSKRHAAFGCSAIDEGCTGPLYQSELPARDSDVFVPSAYAALEPSGGNANGDNQSTPERPVLGRGRGRNAGGLERRAVPDPQTPVRSVPLRWIDDQALLRRDALEGRLQGGRGCCAG